MSWVPEWLEKAAEREGWGETDWKSFARLWAMLEERGMKSLHPEGDDDVMVTGIVALFPPDADKPGEDRKERVPVDNDRAERVERPVFDAISRLANQFFG
jgi:hypothetical protein